MSKFSVHRKDPSNPVEVDRFLPVFRRSSVEINSLLYFAEHPVAEQPWQQQKVVKMKLKISKGATKVFTILYMFYITNWEGIISTGLCVQLQLISSIVLATEQLVIKWIFLIFSSFHLSQNILCVLGLDNMERALYLNIFSSEIRCTLETASKIKYRH